MIKLIAILILLVLIAVFIVSYLLNKKTPSPIDNETKRLCKNCNIECSLRGKDK